MKYAAVSINHDRFMGFMISFGFLLSVVIAFYLGLFFKTPFLISMVGSFFLFQIIIYFLLILRADTKAKFIESVLPDVLQLMSSNLRAGFTTDKALLLSARPEFGPFQDELNQVGKKITMGKKIDEALLDVTTKTRSERLSKTIKLIVSGLNSGGELASLLEQTAKNLRQEELVDSRIRSNVMMYVIFIFSAVCFGAPLLFGLSSFLVEVLTKTIGSVQLPDSGMGGLPLSFTEISIDPGFVIMFAVVFLVTSSILGSLIIGLISKGKEREGIKFMPVLITASLSVFFIARIVIKNLLSGLFGT